MALAKQQLDISFAQGLDTKTDPNRVSPGRFLSLQNSVFDKLGQLTKRNGFPKLATLPDSSSTFLTTFNGNLTAIGNNFQAYSSGNMSWVNKGPFKPVKLSTLTLIRSNLTQVSSDAAIASNGYVCTVYSESGNGSTTFKYVVADSVTGQNIVSPMDLPISAGTVVEGARVFILSSYFIIIYPNTVAGVTSLKYIAVSILNPASSTLPANITASYTPGTSAFDGAVTNNRLFIAYNTQAGGQSVKVTYLTATLTLVTPVTFTSEIATIISVTADMFVPANPTIYISMYDDSSQVSKVMGLDQNLNTILSPTTLFSAMDISALTASAYNGILTVYSEEAIDYGYDSAIPTHLINKLKITRSGTTLSNIVLLRSVGLASKAFLVNGLSYILTVYDSPYQPTYFLSDENGNLSVKLAYSNAGGYITGNLPSVTVNGNLAQCSYLIKDLIQSVNKNTAVPAGTPTAGIYAQTGINLVNINLNSSNIITSEIGNNLNLTGGFLWSYDGYSPVEQGFHLYPDSVEATWSATGGAIPAQPDGATNTNAYWYQATYEWADNQGNQFKSSPSIPVAVTTTGSAMTGSISIDVPTLRLTYKTANPVKIVIYRWSVAQQVYYQVTSISTPTLNDLSVDYITFVDTLSDATILGNNILYTTGGVLEDIAAPACNTMTLFNNRLWVLDAEDQNLLWFSKQVIEATPIEMSDLLTVYVAPTISAQGSTGPIVALAALDDKLIIFKKDAIYYLNGNGPDNTGANNQYSQPSFITSTVGCSDQNSIVFIPQGIMFQSDKGIWLLDRNLSTNYIGSPVEQFNSNIVVSALNIPGTNQVRFTLDSGITLMYDYFVNQWGTFVGIPGISSTLSDGLHTYLNSSGQVFRELPNTYLDNSNPVLMAAQTGWMALAGVQGFERFYDMQVLGNYISPFILRMQMTYDYNQFSPLQTTIVTPANIYSTYGSDSVYGGGEVYGGQGKVFEAQVFPQQQKCESFQIAFQEVYDPSFGVAAGAGLTLTGLTLTVGLKKGTRNNPASRSFG